MAGPTPPRCDACGITLFFVKTRLEVSTEFRAREIEAAEGSGLPKEAAARVTVTTPRMLETAAALLCYSAEKEIWERRRVPDLSVFIKGKGQ